LADILFSGQIQSNNAKDVQLDGKITIAKKLYIKEHQKPGVLNEHREKSKRKKKRNWFEPSGVG
jgi:hypothetical protein